MREFKIKNGNYIKDKNNTSTMMYTILIILSFFILFSTYKNGIYPVIKGYGNLYLIFKPLIFAIVSSVVGIITEYLYYLIRRNKKSFYKLFNEEYAIIPGVFLSLIISINTPIYLLILGSIIASLSKVLTGGFGKNKLNPALVGSLFITIFFSSLVGGYLNPYEVDSLSSATPLSNMTASSYVITYDKLVAPFGSLLNFFFGNIPGSIGETSALLCIVSFIYLTYKKIIKWRMPVCYVLTVVLISLIICLTKDIGLWFILFNILSGGLLFGAVFMATDPVTTPITHVGEVLSGILLGVITMIIRYLTPLPEGVLISILIVNLITILINYLSIKLYNKKIIKILILVLSIILTVMISIFISTKVLNKEPDDNFSILSKTKNGNITTYEVMGRGYAGKNSLKLKIVFNNSNITNIELLKSNETYTSIVKDNKYLDKIINNQDNLDNLDTISGCTYTTGYLKEIVSKTIEDYQK